MPRTLARAVAMLALVGCTATEPMPFVPKRVTLIGDSITAHLGPLGPWFGPEASGWTNAAVGGETSFDLVDRLDRSLPAGTQICVLMVGVNDAAGGWSAQATADNIRWLVESLRARGIVPILGTILPVATTYTLSDPAVLNARVEPRNAWIRYYAAANGIALADYAAAFAGPDGAGRPELFLEGLHPNEAGNAVLVATARPVLRRLAALP